MTPTPPSKLLAILAICATVPSGQAALVFADDFSEPDGTEIIGKDPDVGEAWTGTAPTISSSSFDSTGAGRAAFANFSTALGAGEVLTLTYDTFAVAGGNFFSEGYAGVSLYADDSEQAFTGDLGIDTFWGVDQGIVGGAQTSSDSTAETSAVFRYFFDTGDWSFTTTSGVDLSGTGTAGVALDQIRVANGAGGDIRVDNLQVDVVPEPSASMAALLGLLVVGGRRRRA